MNGAPTADAPAVTDAATASTPAAPRPGAAAALRGISVRFGGVVALDDVSLDIPAGRAAGIIGPNGAGKSTLLNSISGFVRLTSGRIILDGTDVTGLSPTRRAVAGIGRTFQTPKLFAGLTVGENLAVVARRRRVDGLAPREALRLVGLAGSEHARVESLAAGERRFAEMARALMLAPTVLLLDEPATGLRDAEVDTLIACVTSLVTRHSLTVLAISHDMRLINECCEQVAVIDRGRLLTHGTPDEIRRDQRVIEAYFGTELSR